MVSQLINRAYTGLSQQLGRQVGLVGLRLHEQAKTKIWARMALDMFFPPVFEVKNAPESLLRSLSVPVVQTPVAPRTTQSPAATFEIPKAPPPFTSKVLDAVAAFNCATEPAQAPARPAAEADRLKKLAALPKPVSGPVIRSAAATKTEVPVGPLSQEAYKLLPLHVKKARKAALARLSGTYAETREIYGLAFSLNKRIEVYRYDGDTGRLEASGVGNDLVVDERDRIGVVLDGEHFMPMGKLPPLYSSSIPYDIDMFEIGTALPYGNCFYESVAQLLKKANPLIQNASPIELRRRACDGAQHKNNKFPLEPNAEEDAVRYAA